MKKLIVMFSRVLPSARRLEQCCLKYLATLTWVKSKAGAGVGALACVLQGKKEKEVEVVVVDPQTDLELTLEEDLETDLVSVRR